MTGRGRPRQPWAVPVLIWAMVELKRDRPQGARHSARQAARWLYNHMKPFAPLLKESTIREAHKKYERERGEPVDVLLEEYRARREVLGWDASPLQLVGIISPKN